MDLFAKLENSLLIIDDFDKLTYENKIYFVRSLLKLQHKSKILISVSTNDPQNLIEYFNNVQVFEVSESSKEEFIDRFIKNKHFDKEKLAKLYDEMGPAHDFASDMLDKGKSVEEYLENTKKSIQENTEYLIASKPELAISLISALMTVKPNQQLGNIFAESDIGKELVELGLMKSHAHSTVRFRNKFIIKCIEDILAK